MHVMSPSDISHTTNGKAYASYASYALRVFEDLSFGLGIWLADPMDIRFDEAITITAMQAFNVSGNAALAYLLRSSHIDRKRAFR